MTILPQFADRITTSVSNQLSCTECEMGTLRPHFASVNTYRGAYEWLHGMARGTLPSNIEVHHIFPKIQQAWFAARGINVHVPLWLTEINAVAHRASGAAATYNVRWNAWIADNPNAKLEEIFAMARELMVEVYNMQVNF